MKKPDRFELFVRLSGFVSCTLLGFCIASALWDYPGAKDKWSDYLGAAATLIGAFTALIAALIAYAAIMKQTEVAQNDAKDNRERQLKAERHINVLTISEIHRICEDNFIKIHSYLKGEGDTSNKSPLSSQILLGSISHIEYSYLERLKSIISLSEPNLRDAFIELFQESQVLDARIFDKDMYNESHHIVSNLEDILKYLSLLDRFYPYFRGETEGIDRDNLSHDLQRQCRVVLRGERPHSELKFALDAIDPSGV